MKEFLFLVKNEAVQSKQELIPQVSKSMKSWIQRVPNSAFDQLNVWDDILTARSLFIDLYEFKFQADFQRALMGDKDLNDIRAIL